MLSVYSCRSVIIILFLATVVASVNILLLLLLLFAIVLLPHIIVTLNNVYHLHIVWTIVTPIFLLSLVHHLIILHLNLVCIAFEALSMWSLVGCSILVILDLLHALIASVLWNQFLLLDVLLLSVRAHIHIVVYCFLTILGETLLPSHVIILL